MIQFSMILVTPEMAADWLLHHNNRNYRNMKRHIVLLYAKRMRDGQWHANGETIIFDSDGELLDGQHRLSAVVEYGKSVEMAIARGVAPGTEGTIDGTDNPRNLANTLHYLYGYAYPGQVASICRSLNKMWMIERKDLNLRGQYEIRQFEQRFGLEGPIHAVLNAMHMQRKLSSAPICSALTLAYKLNPEKCIEFASQLREVQLDGQTQQNMPKSGEPAYALRKYVESIVNAGAPSVKRMLFFRTITAACHHFRGKRIQAITPIYEDYMRCSRAYGVEVCGDGENIPSTVIEAAQVP